jgi:oxygen-independent coproporphyrinogen-3 oxidase
MVIAGLFPGAAGPTPISREVGGGPAFGHHATVNFGVYVHVPFCRHKCDYCAFATWTDRASLVPRYLEACRRQVADAVADGLPPVTSVFVGGGTPSLVPPADLMAVLAPLPLADGAEVTVESNPDDVTDDLVAAYRDGGVTRMSFGVQSMVPSVLAGLGRTHDPDNVRRSVASARRHGLACNLDLIYGAAGETLAQWATTVDEVVALTPDHVSAYALTVEAGTPLAADAARHPDDDDQADKYLLVTDRMEAAGYRWYEISNWARPGHECRHNALYWSQGEYLAVGCAAHGHRDGRRYWNLRTPERFIDAVENGRSPEAGSEVLPVGERRVEGLQLAIRTLDGVAGVDVDDDLLASLDGLVDRRGDRVVLTPRGRLLANEVAIRLG